MVHKTRRHHSNKKSKGIYSIPELRRSFEHIESYINEKIALKDSKEKLVKDLRKEWSKVFFKELDKKSAESFEVKSSAYSLPFTPRIQPSEILPAMKSTAFMN